jgi:Ni/Co efflux regulator RcnB
MKARWWLAGCAAALLGFTGAVAVAHSTSQGKQENRADHKFSDHDKQAAHDWVTKHHDNLPAGFREEDKLTPEFEGRLTVGTVLDRDLRAKIRPVPEDLLATLTPPPAGYRYLIIGDHIVLVDEGWHVQDVLHLEVNL